MGWGSGVAVSCGVGRRCGWDPELLWLWRRPSATAPIRPLAWEPPCAAGAALEMAKRQKKKKKKKKKKGLCAQGLEELMLLISLKYSFCLKQSTYSMQSVSKFQWCFSKNGTNNSKILWNHKKS